MRWCVVQLCLIAAIYGSGPSALAQFAPIPKINGIPEAPIGHRQPNAADVPASDSVEGGALGARAPDSFGSALRSLPKLDIRSTCRRAQPLLAGGNGTYRSCLDDEIEAQKALSHKWFAFKSRTRAICTRDTIIGGAPSFVELLTCLELEQQAAEARLENTKPL